jgi:hypothetical protein
MGLFWTLSFLSKVKLGDLKFYFDSIKQTGGGMQ